MQENVELVQRGFRCLVKSLSGYIGQELSKKYRDNWWSEVRYSLNDQYDLPYTGDYGKLVDSLDIANCIRLIDRRWGKDFREHLSPNLAAKTIENFDCFRYSIIIITREEMIP